MPNDSHLPLSRCLSVDLEVTKRDQRIRAFAGVRWDSGESFVYPGTGDRLLPALAKLDDLLSRAATRCTTAAAESCTTGTMRKN